MPDVFICLFIFFLHNFFEKTGSSSNAGSRSSDVSFVVGLDKPLNKHSICRWFEKQRRSCDVTVIRMRSPVQCRYNAVIFSTMENKTNTMAAVTLVPCVARPSMVLSMYCVYGLPSRRKGGRIPIISVNMMTSSNGYIFRVTGPLCGEFTGHRWIPRTKASDAEFWCFPWSAPE